MQLAEAGYEEWLFDILRRCIDGERGVFGASDAAHADHFGANRIPANDASERAGHIAELRVHLGHVEPFPLHERFMAYRAIVTDPNAHGEPKLAQQFFDEIDRDAACGRKA